MRELLPNFKIIMSWFKFSKCHFAIKMYIFHTVSRGKRLTKIVNLFTLCFSIYPLLSRYLPILYELFTRVKYCLLYTYLPEKFPSRTSHVSFTLSSILVQSVKRELFRTLRLLQNMRDFFPMGIKRRLILENERESFEVTIMNQKLWPKTNYLQFLRVLLTPNFRKN